MSGPAPIACVAGGVLVPTASALIEGAEGVALAIVPSVPGAGVAGTVDAVEVTGVPVLPLVARLSVGVGVEGGTPYALPAGSDMLDGVAAAAGSAGVVGLVCA
jgi:hypothetical protein